MPQDTDLSLDDWTALANAASLGGVNAWNLYQNYTSTLSRLSALELGGGAGGGISVYNVVSYGASALGLVDSNIGIDAALAAAKAAGGGVVYFPPGTYSVDRNASNSWCIDVDADNITLLGVKGQSWIKPKVGLPASSIATVRVNTQSNITIDGVCVDGNWGATVGVTDTIPTWTASTAYTVGQKARWDPATTKQCYVCVTAGTSHATVPPTATSGSITDGTVVWNYLGTGGIDNHNYPMQGTPTKYGFWIRGCTNVTIQNCMVKNTYGDGIWLGSSTDTTGTYRLGGTGYRVLYCDINLTARDGIAIPQTCNNIIITGCRIENTYSTPIDFENVDAPVRNVVISDNYLKGWWNFANPLRVGNYSITACGGKFTMGGEHFFLRNVRIQNNQCAGSILVQCAKDIVVSTNQVVCDWNGTSYSPIHVRMAAEDVRVLDNFVYDRTGESDPGTHDAAISVRYYPGGTTIQAPTNVTVRGNYTYSRNGRHGIYVDGAGGKAYGSGAIQPGIEGTATAVTDVLVSDTTKSWTVNQWTGYRIRMGAAHASIGSNTTTGLDLFPEITYTSGWIDVFGRPTATPAPGPYVIYQPTGIVDVFDNKIDCTDDGYGAGGKGIYLYTGRAGMRVRLRGNDIHNANVDGIYIDFEDAARPILHLEMESNHVWDDQVTPTCVTAIRFVPTVRCDKLIMRNNTRGGAVTASLAGLTTGWWLVNDGDRKEAEGYGTPEGVVTAPVGSRGFRVDGGAGTTYYVKESGTGNTGWVAK